MLISISVGPPESDSRKVGIITSREDNNIRQGHQQQQQELTTITLGTTAETTGITDFNNRRETRNMQEKCQIVELPATVLASAGAPTSDRR
jgi:hypothetical protein